MQSTLHLLALLCVYVAGEVPTSAPGPTKNPECPGMHRAAQRIEKAMITLTRKHSSCSVNTHCSGMNCTGIHKDNDVFVRVELHHCYNPVSLHLDMKYGKDNININKEMKDGDKKKIGKISGIDLYVTVHLHRNRNIVKASLDLDSCVQIPLPLSPKLVCKSISKLLPEQAFCVSMKNCPGYNATAEPPLPCGPSTTSSPHHTGTGQFSSQPTRFRSYTEHIKPTGQATAVPGIHEHRKGAKDHKIRMSVGVAIGIGCGGLLALLIIAGTVVYWSKYHRRSRLRAAYYNDISMNDPLYEDFEPEVA